MEFQKSNNVAALQEEGKGALSYLAALKVDLERYRLDHERLSNEVDAAKVAAQAADADAAQAVAKVLATAADTASDTNALAAASGATFTNATGASGLAARTSRDRPALLARLPPLIWPPPAATRSSGR